MRPDTFGSFRQMFVRRLQQTIEEVQAGHRDEWMAIYQAHLADVKEEATPGLIFIRPTVVSSLLMIALEIHLGKYN